MPDQQKTPFKRMKEYLERHPIAFVVLTIATFLGFASGIINSVQTIREFLLPVPTHYAATLENPIRLSGEDVRLLLTGNSETGKIIEPSEEEIEGRPNTWYGARYFEDGTMAYNHADHQAPDADWDWYIDEDGNLCRGPVWAIFRSCRTIVSVGDNVYHAIGLRTGTLRYQFSMNEARALDKKGLAIFVLTAVLMVLMGFLLWARFSRQSPSESSPPL